jgi:hypothetical protein
MKIRLHTIGLRHDGRNFPEGVDHEVGDGEDQIPADLAEARLAAKTAVVVYADGVEPEFALALADYVSALTGLGDRLVVVLDLAEAGGDDDAVALVEAIKGHNARLVETVGPRMEALFRRVHPAATFDFDQPLNSGATATALEATDRAGDDGSASSNGASSEAADTPVASTTIAPIEPAPPAQTGAAEPVEPLAPAPRKGGKGAAVAAKAEG